MSDLKRRVKAIEKRRKERKDRASGEVLCVLLPGQQLTPEQRARLAPDAIVIVMDV